MAELGYGTVVGQYRLVSAGTERAAAGVVRFSPVEPDETTDFATVYTREAFNVTLDEDGWLRSEGGQVDELRVPAGRWEVSFRNVPGLTVKPFQFDVPAGETVILPQVQPLIPSPAVKFVVNEQVYTETLAARVAAEDARDIAVQAAEDATAPTEQVVDARIDAKRNTANGLAPLGPDSKVPLARIPVEAIATSAEVGAVVDDALEPALTEITDLKTKTTTGYLAPAKVAPLVGGKLPDANVPDRLTETALSATIAQSMNRIQALPIAGEVDVYGESLTAAALFETNLASYTGLTVANRGVAGVGVMDHLMRMGAVRPQVTLTGNQIPDGTTPVAITAINPSRGWRVSTETFNIAVTGYLGGVRGLLTHKTDTDTWTFTRGAAGTAVDVPPGSEFTRAEDLITPTRRLIFWGGRNNVTATMRSIAEMVPAALDAQRTRVKEALVIGVINGLSEGTGTTNYNRVVAYNNRLKELFGDTYLDIRRGFIDRGLTIRGITPTSADLANIAADKPPASLMTDELHPNADGYLVINYLVAEKLLALGWVTSLSLPPVPETWAVVTSDSFNRADTTSGVLGSTDAAAGGSALAWTSDGELRIIGNELGAASLSTNRWCSVDSGNTNVRAQVKGKRGVGVGIRRVDANNYYEANTTSAGKIQLVRRVTGTVGDIAMMETADGVFADYDTLHVQAIDQSDGTHTIIVSRNGTPVLTRTGATWHTTGTRVHIRSAFSGTTWRADDFLVERKL